MRCSVYVGTSLDGYIAGVEGNLDWLDMIPIPEGNDLGYSAFMQGIDALLMGRVTFETVLGFDVPWPYAKPVFVWSRSEVAIPDELTGKAEGIQGTAEQIVDALAARGHASLYIDGGTVVQSFLAADLVDELIVNRLPIVLGGGIPLFGALPEPRTFEHVQTDVLLGQMVKSRYRRLR